MPFEKMDGFLSAKNNIDVDLGCGTMLTMIYFREKINYNLNG